MYPSHRMYLQRENKKWTNTIKVKRMYKKEKIPNTTRTSLKCLYGYEGFCRCCCKCELLKSVLIISKRVCIVSGMEYVTVGEENYNSVNKSIW